MSFLSRFRRNVLPSTPRSKKVIATTADDDVRQFNYRKSTKSFNEKSVKPRNSPLYINSYDDDNNYKVANEKSSNNIGNSKLYGSSTLTTNKPKKKKTDNSLGATVASSRNNNLSRSNTFTLEDEDNLQNGIYPRSLKKGKIKDGFDEPNGR